MHSNLDISGKKEDNLKEDNLLDEKSNNKNYEKNSEKKNQKALFTQPQPLTELSRKAEEEVNHLTRNQQNNSIKKSNSTQATHNSSTEITEESLKSLKDNNTIDTISKINETLQILDKSGESSLKNSSSSSSSNILENSSKRFMETLKNKVDTMSPVKAHNVQEKGKTLLTFLMYNYTSILRI